jgi:hypothetical protein
MRRAFLVTKVRIEQLASMAINLAHPFADASFRPTWLWLRPRYAEDNISHGKKGERGLDAVRYPSRLEIFFRHPGPALRRLAPLTAAMDRLEGANQKICPAR